MSTQASVLRLEVEVVVRHQLLRTSLWLSTRGTSRSFPQFRRDHRRVSDGPRPCPRGTTARCTGNSPMAHPGSGRRYRQGHRTGSVGCRTPPSAKRSSADTWWMTPHATDSGWPSWRSACRVLAYIHMTPSVQASNQTRRNASRRVSHSRPSYRLSPIRISYSSTLVVSVHPQVVLGGAGTKWQDGGRGRPGWSHHVHLRSLVRRRPAGHHRSRPREAVADAVHVEDVGRVGGLVAELLAELLHGGADAFGVAGAPAPPTPGGGAPRWSRPAPRLPRGRAAARAPMVVSWTSRPPTPARR